MAKKNKKPEKLTKVEIIDTFAPILAACWVLVFGYIALFNGSALLANLLVFPMILLYGLYLPASAFYCYKELEIMKELGKPTFDLERKYRKNPPKLSVAKLSVGGGCIVAAILLFIFI